MSIVYQKEKITDTDKLSVKTYEQELTEEQKAQARENIGANLTEDYTVDVNTLWGKTNFTKTVRCRIASLSNNHYTLTVENCGSDSEVRVVQTAMNSKGDTTVEMYVRKGVWNNGDSDITWTSWEKFLTEKNIVTVYDANASHSDINNRLNAIQTVFASNKNIQKAVIRYSGGYYFVYEFYRWSTTYVYVTEIGIDTKVMNSWRTVNNSTFTRAVNYF